MLPQTMLLDAGGVLVWPNWARLADALRRRGVEVDPRALAAGEPHARHALDSAAIIGGSSDQRRGVDYFDLVLRHAGVPPSKATAAALDEIWAYHRALNLWEHVPEFVVPALTELKALGCRLVVVSNSNGTVRVLFDRLGLACFFHVLVDSAEERLEKPDPRLFTLALERAGGTAAAACHVGDMYHVDVVGARAAGIRPILVDEAGLKDGVDCQTIRSIAELPFVLGGAVHGYHGQKP